MQKEMKRMHKWSNPSSWRATELSNNFPTHPFFCRDIKLQISSRIGTGCAISYGGAENRKRAPSVLSTRTTSLMGTAAQQIYRKKESQTKIKKIEDSSFFPYQTVHLQSVKWNRKTTIVWHVFRIVVFSSATVWWRQQSRIGVLSENSSRKRGFSWRHSSNFDLFRGFLRVFLNAKTNDGL